MKRIMIVEDDNDIRNELINLLNSINYECSYIKDFNNTLNEIIVYNPELVLLDINIPFIDGYNILKALRRKTKVPVIVVTSKNTDIDEITLMSCGADDYITKPYNPTILLLRMSNILKRYSNINVINYRDLLFDISKGIIIHGKDEIILTKNEIIIFSLLLNNQDRIVTKDEIMTDLWNNEEYVNDNALKVNISRLRTKLASIGYDDIIETRKGIGYRII